MVPTRIVELDSGLLDEIIGDAARRLFENQEFFPVQNEGGA